MAKAELQAAQMSYDQLIGLALEDERAGRFADAISHAIDAWDHLDGMMKYEKKWEGREFKSVPCIDLVLKYAPLVFDASSLDRMGALLKAQKSIDRLASDDLASRLSEARSLMVRSHRLWQHLCHNRGVRQDSLRATLGGDQEEWRHLCERWDSMQMLRRVPSGGSYELWVATNLEDKVRGRCSGCGRAVRGRKLDMLADQTCPSCQKSCMFVMVPELDEAAD